MKKFSIALLASAALWSCGNYEQTEKPAYTLTEPVTIVERAENGDYELQINKAGTWQIFEGASIKSIDWQKPIATATGSYVFSPQKNARPYFALVNGKDTLYSSSRAVYMENAINFRDLGGIPTQDGRYTKWGKIFRSAELQDLSKEDQQTFRELGIGSIIDLRSDKEIEEAPDNYPQDADIVWIHNPFGNLSGAQMDSLFDLIKNADPEGCVGEDFMEKANHDFALSGQENVKRTFDELLQKDRPVLFHCTAGKDRTGFTSALILSALGVERDVVVQEYLLSNYYRHGENEESLKKAANFMGLDHRILRPMMAVKANYINSAFAVIDSQFGGVDNYLKNSVGLTDADLNQLRETYLY